MDWAESSCLNLKLYFECLNVEHVCFNLNVFTLSSYKVILHIRVILEIPNQIYRVVIVSSCKAVSNMYMIWGYQWYNLLQKVSSWLKWILQNQVPAGRLEPISSDSSRINTLSQLTKLIIFMDCDWIGQDKVDTQAR